MGGIYDILNFLTGSELFTHQLPRALTRCLPWILQQHPCLAAPALEGEAVATLDAALAQASETDAVAICASWLARQKALYGSTLPLTPLSIPEEFATPVADLVEMMGAERVLIIDPEGTPDAS
jgi:hypothetical protein